MVVVVVVVAVVEDVLLVVPPTKVGKKTSSWCGGCGDSGQTVALVWTVHCC